MIDYPTIEDLVAHLLSVLFPDQVTAPSATDVASPAVVESSEQGWDEQLQEVAELNEDQVLRQLQGGR